MEVFVPAHFIVDSERRLVTVKFDSAVTVQDVVQYFESLKANPAFDPDFSELVDLMQVMSSEVDFQAAMMLAREVDPFSRKGRRAFVAPSATPLAEVVGECDSLLHVGEILMRIAACLCCSYGDEPLIADEGIR